MTSGRFLGGLLAGICHAGVVGFAFDAIVSFTPGNHRLGVGITEHFPTHTDCDACDRLNQIDVNSATGLLAQWVYTAGYFELGVRGTVIHYQPASSRFAAGGSVNGNSLGGFFGVRL